MERGTSRCCARRRPRSLLAAAAAAAALLLLLAPPRAADAAKPPPGPLLAGAATEVTSAPDLGDAFEATVAPDHGGGGRAIRQLLGVSVEWDRVADYDNARWPRVFSLLGPSPVLRVGGSSTEMLTALPPPDTWRALRRLGRDAGVRLVINLKLSGGDVGFTEKLFEAAIREVGPHILAFELGNEVSEKGHLRVRLRCGMVGGGEPVHLLCVLIGTQRSPTHFPFDRPPFLHQRVCASLLIAARVLAERRRRLRPRDQEVHAWVGRV